MLTCKRCTWRRMGKPCGQCRGRLKQATVCAARHEAQGVRVGTTRRQFLKASAAAGAGVLLSPTLSWGQRVGAAETPPALSNPSLQPMFVNPVPNAADPTFTFKSKKSKTQTLTSARRCNRPASSTPRPAPLYLHRYLDTARTASTPGRARRYLPQSGNPTSVKWKNKLTDPLTGAPVDHILPVDTSLHWAYSLPGTGTTPSKRTACRSSRMYTAATTTLRLTGTPSSSSARTSESKGPQWDREDKESNRLRQQPARRNPVVSRPRPRVSRDSTCTPEWPGSTSFTTPSTPGFSAIRWDCRRSRMSRRLRSRIGCSSANGEPSTRHSRATPSTTISSPAKALSFRPISSPTAAPRRWLSLRGSHGRQRQDLAEDGRRAMQLSAQAAQWLRQSVRGLKFDRCRGRVQRTSSAHRYASRSPSSAATRVSPRARRRSRRC